MGASWIDRLRGWIMLGPPVIEQGSEGEAVTNWQHIVGIAPADGVFGPITANYTRQWQSAHGIEPDAVVGPITWRSALSSAPARITGNVPASSGEMQPLPPGTKPLPQAVANDPAITAFAVELVHTPDKYPMGSITSRQFGDKTVLGRIEKHTWTHRAGKLVTGLNPPIRGATLYLASSEFAGEFAAVGKGNILYSSEMSGDSIAHSIPGIPYVHPVTQIGCYEYNRKKGLPQP